MPTRCDLSRRKKKRGRPWAPPWIKIYPRLLDEPRFMALTPETRMLLVGLFMLFSRTRGTVTKDTRNLSRQLSQRVTDRQLQALNEAGWIRFCSGTVREQLWNVFWNGSSLEVEVEVEEPPTPEPLPKGVAATPDIDFGTPPRHQPHGAGAGTEPNLEPRTPRDVLDRLRART